MLQYLVNVTDNTFIPVIVSALLVAMMLHTLAKGQFWLWGGVIAGGMIALGYAILKRNTGIAVREFYDLALIIGWLTIALPLLVSALGCSRLATSQIGRLFLGLLQALGLAIVTALFLPNLLLFPFEFSVAMGSIYNTDYLFKIVGYLTALAVALLIGHGVYRTCQRLSQAVILIFYSVAILLFTLQNFITLAQILLVRRLISYQPWLMEMVMFVLGHVNLFNALFLLWVILLSIVQFIKANTTSLIASNPARVRLIKAQVRRDRRTSLILFAGVVITAYTITRARYLFEKGVELSPAEPVEALNGLISIGLEKVNDGNLHRFGYTTNDGTLVRFIVIKKSENAYGVGLDACDICGASGYYQRGDQVVCILCDVVMNIATIGFPGGCNPVPLKFEIIDGKMIVKSLHLEAEKSRFK